VDRFACDWHRLAGVLDESSRQRACPLPLRPARQRNHGPGRTPLPQPSPVTPPSAALLEPNGDGSTERRSRSRPFRRGGDRCHGENPSTGCTKRPDGLGRCCTRRNDVVDDDHRQIACQARTASSERTDEVGRPLRLRQPGLISDGARLLEQRRDGGRQTQSTQVRCRRACGRPDAVMAAPTHRGPGRRDRHQPNRRPRLTCAAGVIADQAGQRKCPAEVVAQHLPPALLVGQQHGTQVAVIRCACADRHQVPTDRSARSAGLANREPPPNRYRVVQLVATRAAQRSDHAVETAAPSARRRGQQVQDRAAGLRQAPVKRRYPSHTHDLRRSQPSAASAAAGLLSELGEPVESIGGRTAMRRDRDQPG
jgi:hypothetical protein